MAVGELVVSIIGDMQALSKTFQQVQNDLGTVGTKLQSIGSTLSSTGKTMSTYITAPLVGIGAASIYTASNFDDSMRKVQAVSGATGEDFDKLSTQARELGATTAFSAVMPQTRCIISRLPDGMSTKRCLQPLDFFLSQVQPGWI